MSRVTPDGKKIAQFRKELSLSQEALAEGRISVRLLRDVERRDKPLGEVVLRNIATALKRPLDAIVLKQAPKVDWETIARPRSRSQLLLELVKSGSELQTAAYYSAKFSWALEAEPVSETASLMEEVLKIVSREVNRGMDDPRFSDDPYRRKTDDYDAQHEFPTLFRIARLNEILQLLAGRGIAVLSNTYVHRLCTERDGFAIDEDQVRLYLGFYPEGTTAKIVHIDPGLPSPVEAEQMDDDLPF